MYDSAETQRRIWTSGDYPTIARHLLPVSVATVAAIGIRPGDRVLDVCVGTGNAAIEAARRGGVVTGIDLTPAQIELARQRCAREAVDVELRVGDAEALDVADGSFDVVMSVMGIIFAPNPDRAAAELARACRPGGTVAMTAWAVGGWSGRWRARTRELFPAQPPGSPEPDAWSEPAELLRRLGAAGLEATVEERPFSFDFPSLERALEMFLCASGPFVQMLKMAQGLGRADDFLAALRDAFEECNEATDGSCRLASPYLLAIAARR